MKNFRNEWNLIKSLINFVCFSVCERRNCVVVEAFVIVSFRAQNI